MPYCVVFSDDTILSHKNIQLLNNNNFNNIYPPNISNINGLKVSKNLVKYGPTKNRPTNLLEPTDAGFIYYDTDVLYPVFWSGNKWVNASGKVE